MHQFQKFDFAQGRMLQTTKNNYVWVIHGRQHSINKQQMTFDF